MPQGKPQDGRTLTALEPQSPSGSAESERAGPPTGQRPVAVDLFSGAGGFTLGLEQAGFDVVAAVEYDPVHAATHEFNFPDTAMVCAGVSDLAASDLRGRACLGNRRIDLVVGGPPCQGFSLIGKRAIEDTRNRLVFDFHRLVVGMEARYFIMENVPGMKAGAQAGLLAELVSAFSESGYECRPVSLLTATDFGVPQERTRLFLVGAASGEAPPRPPSPTTSPTGLLLPRCPTVWDAFGDLPEVQDYPELLDCDETRADFTKPTAYAEEMRCLALALDDYSYGRLWNPDLLTSSMRTVHTPESIRRFEETPPGSVEPVSRFLRLKPDGFCNTLRAGTDSKRGAHTSPRPIHPFAPRVVTVREAARLHSFPDWFRLHATKWHGFRQVGNAVAPRVGRAMGRSVMDALGHIPKAPAGTVALGDTTLLTLSMSEAAEHYGVPSDVVGRRDRPRQRRAS